MLILCNICCCSIHQQHSMKTSRGSAIYLSILLPVSPSLGWSATNCKITALKLLCVVSVITTSASISLLSLLVILSLSLSPFPLIEYYPSAEYFPPVGSSSSLISLLPQSWHQLSQVESCVPLLLVPCCPNKPMVLVMVVVQLHCFPPLLALC